MKDLPNIIELQLLAVDFKDASFLDNNDCAVSRACKRQLGVENVSEYIYSVDIGWVEYTHGYYGSWVFEEDYKKAKTVEPNTVIRTLTLTKS